MAINSYPDNSGGPVEFPEQLIDPVSKFRVSNPENLIDTDFEYGLQPTKWETVELINNTPSFFSKSGDTTIDGISSIITNAGTREIIVKTELDHGLAVGIPINVTGTKSITADGAYIINSIPDPKTFTYLCKDNQPDTNSILDLYSSIITGEFFQGSQLRISDSDGIVTDAAGTSILTVTTNTTHGFGENTPFYFLNLNSTVAQEFQAANTASKSFDASNSATAQTFDGSNSLSSVSIDWSNSATFGGTPSTITSVNAPADTITVSHTSENFNNLPQGTPLYYDVTTISGYFNANPRGVVFLLRTNYDNLGTSSSTFQVSLVPDGDPINILSAMIGTFQIANQARTFAGNNINPATQTVLDVEVGASFNFDAANQGYTGEVQETPPNNTLTVLSYTGTTINADGASAADYYVGAMVLYSSTGTAATGLVNNTTYFVKTVTNNGGGNYDFSVAPLPNGTAISITTGTGSGTQTFSRIGLSVDKDIVHIPNSNFSEDDMLEYTFPVDGRFDVSDPEEEKRFYFVELAYDAHNYKLSEDVGFRPIEATGGTLLPDIVDRGRTWKVHQFTTTGTSNFVVSDIGKEGIIEYLVVAGGGSGGTRHAGGGGGGGVISGSTTVTAQSYPIVVGAGGANPGAPGSSTTNVNGVAGSNSSAFGQTAFGGGSGSTYAQAGGNGGSGGGAGERTTNIAQANGGTGVAGQGFAGGRNNASGDYLGSGGGGGAGGAGQDAQVRANPGGGNGGPGRFSNITGTSVAYGGGGGGSTYGNSSNNDANFKNHGSGGVGGGGAGATFDGVPGSANTGGGGGGGSSDGTLANGRGGNGGSGIVIVRYPITPPIETFVPAAATGGVISQTVDQGLLYRIHTFGTVGTSTFTVTNVGSWNQFEYLVVGGGGGGGAGVSGNDCGGGGGGAGGFLTGSMALAQQSYSVSVGAGAAGRLASNNSAIPNGGNSSFGTIVAFGGGSGGNRNAIAPTSGGSGAGGSCDSASYPIATGVAGQGNSGGGGTGTPAGASYGGGGAGGVGLNNYGTGGGGSGGLGRFSSISGQTTAYAGGGGGGQGNGPSAPGFGGSLVGGNGATRSGGSATAGAANTGSGGGGGGGFPGPGGAAGGSGIVIIRYPIAVIDPTEYLSATGGDSISTTTVGNTVYAIHRFASVGTTNFNVTSTASVSANNTVEVLVIAGGGGGGGGYQGGGGGAGGMLEGTATPVVGSYPIVVGAGGRGATSGTRNQSGGNSSAFGIVATGGGMGAGEMQAFGESGSINAAGGGSGGGAGHPTYQSAQQGIAGPPRQGFNGGTTWGGCCSMAGGGGAGEAGQFAPSDGNAGRGGNGRSSSITGQAVTYAGGGGGANRGAGNRAAGGTGGGGAGGNNDTGTAGANGFGGGGGGGGSNNGTGIGGSGGSGVVIIRYPIGVIS